MNNIIANKRTSVLSELIASRLTESANELGRSKLLVVGCGSGIEAAVLAKDLNAEVTGVDLSTDFDPRACQVATLQQGDATALEFPDKAFDVVYSYHALEHIPDYHAALNEMQRVLREGGIWCIGTPNRARILGYLGGKSSLRDKLAWNWNDWCMRLQGRFRNENGAHAGYTSSELKDILSQHFGSVEELTGQYYRNLYSRQLGAIRFLIATGVGQFVFPSVYFLGGK
jgi:ubiquinone/menaquinone biosynthesis C-methylase UbiE